MSRLIAGTLDEVRQVTDCGQVSGETVRNPEESELLTGKREWEINSGEQDGQEQVPSEHGDDEGERTTGNERLGDLLAFGSVEEDGSETAESRHEAGEDDDEDQVGAKGDDEIDQAEHTHEDQDESWW